MGNENKAEDLRVTWHKNGRKAKVVHPSEGWWVFWHDNGQKAEEGKYDGACVNWHRTVNWYRTGKKSAERSYKGCGLITAVAWKPNGEKCPFTNVVDGNGMMVDYHENGNRECESHCKNSLEHGDAIFYHESGAKRLLMPYKEGKLDGLIIDWDRNGRKRCEMGLREDCNHGPWTYYNEDGTVRRHITFKNGEPEGPWIIYNQDGTEKKRLNYGDD